MDLIATELTTERVMLTGRNGHKVEFTRDEAKATGSVDAAREAFLLALKPLGDQVSDRCVFLGMTDDFAFTDLDVITKDPDIPPLPRELDVDESGNVVVIAFDGQKTTIAAADAKADLSTEIAVACFTPDAKYQIESLVTKDGTPLTDKLAAAEVTGEIIP